MKHSEIKIISIETDPLVSLVNTTLTGDQHNPSVTILNDGSFVVLWQTSGISGQRFSATGEKLGNEFLVSNTAAGGGIRMFR